MCASGIPSFIRILPLCAMLVSASHAELASRALAPYEEDAERSIQKGLAYLASAQEEDGSFPHVYGKNSAVVGLVAMAFLSKGHAPGLEPYGDVINSCIDFCLDKQQDNGYMGLVGGGGMYAHNITTLLLLEVSGMVDPERQARLDEAIPKAVKIILSAQQVNKEPRHRGGWRYATDSKDSDLSCSGWAVMALRSARLNGAQIPDESINQAVEYLMKNRSTETGQFGYQSPAGHPLTLTGAGLLCMELCGYHGEPETYQAGEYLLRVHEELPRQSHFVYGLYYTAQASFQLGGKYWDTIGSWMYEFWIPHQQEDGSWNVSGSLFDKWKNKPIVYDTAMTILSFTVPYRQLPIYQRDETVDEE
jgi:hypothetical protein